MTFQASDYKGNHFLFDDNYLPIKPTYTKGGTWLKLIGHSNSWCARATRAITNHVPIGEYHLRFFPKENFNCLCRSYPIESRCHILHKCRRYNNYWNHNRESLNHLSLWIILSHPLNLTQEPILSMKESLNSSTTVITLV